MKFESIEKATQFKADLDVAMIDTDGLSKVIAVSKKHNVDISDFIMMVNGPKLREAVNLFLATFNKVKIGYKVVRQYSPYTFLNNCSFSKTTTYKPGEYTYRDKSVAGPMSLFSDRQTAEKFAAKFGDGTSKIFAAEYIPAAETEKEMWFKKLDGSIKKWPVSKSPKGTVLAEGIKLIARV